jgi:leucyl aminopeptidase
MQFEIADADPPQDGTLVIPLGIDGALGEAARRVDKLTGGLIGRIVKAEAARLKHGKAVELAYPAGTDWQRIVLLAAGRKENLLRLDLERLGAGLWPRLRGKGISTLRIAAPAGLELGHDEAEVTAALAAGLGLAAYRFDKYRKPDPEEDDQGPSRVVFHVHKRRAAQAALDRALALNAAVTAARDLVSEPGNVLYPQSFADACRTLALRGLEVEVLDEAELAARGMNAILAVGQGSARPPRLVTLLWRGGKKSQAPLALVGKGVCFDTGGISIKPAQGMEEMKWDMAGAAAVFGAMQAIAAADLPLNVVGVLALAENMPSGTAQRPGDVIRAANGTTIEIVNTDAEGRLILADAMWYARDRFKPKLMVDLATLTGAVVVALGSENAGLFANDDDLARRLTEAGAATGETVWRLPLGKGYSKQIRSDIADIKNVGRAREAGSIAGAVFLEHFAEGTPWAHLDIAGVAWTSRDLPLCPKGSTGFGVRLLDAFVRGYVPGG